MNCGPQEIALFEEVERAALESLHECAAAGLAGRIGLRLERIGGATLSIASGAPGGVVNRVIGLGFGEPASRETVEAITACYRDARVGSYYLHRHPEARPAELSDWLKSAGLARSRGWVKFVRGAEPPPAAITGLTMRRVGEELAGKAGLIAADGFGIAAEGAELVAGLVRDPRWRLYLAYDGDRPAAAAGLFIHERTGWLDWAATLPEFRRRGCQSLLLRTRVADALDLGCTRVVTETGEPAPGDPQHSFHNILRAGFEELHLRENWSPVTVGER